MKAKTVKKPNSTKKTRKEIRRAKRVDKKAKRNEYFTKHKKNSKIVLEGAETPSINVVANQKSKRKHGENTVSNPSTMANSIEKEKRVEKKLKVDMQKQRNRQMIEANWQEDKTIKKLEKQLKLHKRKSKAIPKTFAADGLDYLLEVCDTGNVPDYVGTEMEMANINDDFDEDFNLVMGGNKEELKAKKSKVMPDETDYVEMNSDSLEDQNEGSNSSNESMDENQTGDEDELETCGEDPFSSNDEGEESLPADKDSSNDELFSDADGDDNITAEPRREEKHWQDIYGRLRDKDGNVLKDKAPAEKYIPPAARVSRDDAVNSSNVRLKRQLKGLINRLAESNMHSIATQIEGLYSANSRHDMNETLATIMFENLIGSTSCPERLLLEHVLLVAILHANVGTEVGAFFLQAAVQKFDKILTDYDADMEDKRMDNAVNFLAQLYNFKLFSSGLLHEVLTRLSEKFEEKHVECILNVLKSVGFTLRKDDPATLKALIQRLQAKSACDAANDNPRVKFMIEILLAIRNNNVNKIPNYDTSHSEHLKKIAKSFIRKGNYVTQMNIGLDDLLNADDRGKWWIVGSAWTGKDVGARADKPETKSTGNTFSQKLIALAKKHHMNTETRMNIFCILMSAEDYMDAFEKLLHLGLRNQQEREIVNVLLHCCLSERVYNPYYSVLAQKFCDHDRRFQMIIKCSIWDKLQALRNCSPAQISHLAKLLTHLFLEKGLPISTLKIVQFGELDKITLRFVRQILLGVLLAPDVEQCQDVFQKVSLSEKLKMFRESLRLFVHHFLLRNLGRSGQSRMDARQKSLLEERAQIVDRILMSAQERRRKFL